MRFSVGVDDDLSEFHELFRGDRLIGRALRANPALRIARMPTAWEAFAWAVTEQLIEVEEAVAIQRRLVWKLGRRHDAIGLADSPSAAVIAKAAPAQIESCGLSHTRTIALRRAAKDVYSGRLDLEKTPHEDGWRRLLRIPGIGRRTNEKLALCGQGRHDQIPAIDLAYLKLIGRLSTGNPKARADEAEVRGFFAPYKNWQGLAGHYLLWAAGRGMLP